MNLSDPKKPSGNPDVEQKESGTDQGRDNEDLGASANPPKVDEPKNPASKPHGTTEDQITSMEDEGPGPAEGRTDNKAGG